ncbi:MAG: ABC transporter ATP-binding protein [Oscillospiraceae bacterium]|nr:ABC transporter ATP-binding protein [Oscillospiraceae bacterium]
MIKIYKRAIKDCITADRGCCAMIGILIILGYIGAITPVIMARLIEAGESFIKHGASASAVWHQLIILLGVYAVSGMTYILATPLDKLLIQKGSWKFQERLFKKMCSIPQILLEDSKYFDSYKRAAEAVKNSGYENGVNSLLGILRVSTTFLDSIIMTVISIIILVSFSPYLLIFAVLSTPLSMLISIFSEKAMRKLRRAQTHKKRETEYVWGLFCQKASVKEMRVFGASGFFRRKWLKKRDEMINEELSVRAKILRFRNGADIIKNIFYGMNVALAVVLMIRGHLSIGQFTACLGVFGTLQINLVVFVDQLEYFSESLHIAEEYYDFIDLPDKLDGTADFGGFNDKITLSGVSFSYPNTEKAALDNINLTIKKGEHIVIVGENGSGKTTLSKLITACYEPDSGNITIDGQKISDLKKNSYLKNFSVVSQNFVQYNMTLRENIAMSETGAMYDDERIKAAVKAAGVDDIADIMGGYDVQLGREFGGVELSGGQWQKLAIARGMFRDAPVIILDEPTAALDPFIEYEILTDFSEMAKDRTSIIISHRIGICSKADRIIVMKDGQIVEDGTHKELLDKGGEYCRMWSAQSDWYK